MDFLEVMARATRSPEAQEGRLFELLAGIVTDVGDPAKLGRVKARLQGQQDPDCSDWMMPCFAGGIEARPNVGDPVIVGFIVGDPNRPVFWTTTITGQKGRPVEHMLLGDTLAGLFNRVVDQLAAVNARLDGHISTYNNHQHLVSGVQAGAAAITSAYTTSQDTSSKPSDANKAKAADGSVVGSASSDSVALSATQVVR